MKASAIRVSIPASFCFSLIIGFCVPTILAAVGTVVAAVRPLMKLSLLLLFAAMIGALSAKPSVALDRQIVDQLENGEWGWETGKNTCALNPQRLVFAGDVSSVTIYWDHDIEPAVYRIAEITPNGFVADIVGETRMTADGQPVRWQLVLYATDAFCWHRMDWPLPRCTKPQVRCDQGRNGS